jgi:hypothetical protein
MTHVQHAPADRRTGIFVALIPWVLFSLLANHASVQLAAVAALAAAAIIAVPGTLAGRPKILEIGTVFAFVGIAAAAFMVDPASADTLARYARGIAAALLALIAFGSLLFTPFTEQYARESVPEQHWSSPRFKAVNRELTTMWACVFAAMVPLHLVAGALDTQRSNLLCNWVLPVLLVMWAVKRTGAVESQPVHA